MAAAADEGASGVREVYCAFHALQMRGLAREPQSVLPRARPGQRGGGWRAPGSKGGAVGGCLWTD